MKIFLVLLGITIVTARSSDLPLIRGPIADVTDVAYFVDTPGPKHKTESGNHIASFSEMQLTPYMDQIQGISKRFIKGPLTDFIEVEYLESDPQPKHQPMSGKHIDKFSEVHLAPYIDLISGIPVARRMANINLIPVKRMQAQTGMLRSQAMRSSEVRDKRSEVSNFSQISGQKEILNERAIVPDSAPLHKWWKRGVGFRSKPEADLAGSLGAQFYMLVYGKKERSFPGNRLPITQFLTADKREQLKGIPKTGAPIRQFLIPADKDLQTAALFKSLPKIIIAVNDKIHENIFRQLDPNTPKYPPVNEGIEERLMRPLRPVG